MTPSGWRVLDGHTGVRRQQDELLPNVETHLIRERDVDVCSLYLPDIIGESGIRASIQAPTTDFCHGASVVDDTMLRDPCDNMCCPTNGRVVS
jgi:hypothetical protein